MAKGFNNRGNLGGGGMNLSMVKQAQKMQQDMMNLQTELETKTYEAQSGGGMVTAVITGKKLLEKITIKPEAVDPDDVEMLEDLILAAINEAVRAVEADSTASMQEITGGLNINLPF